MSANWDGTMAGEATTRLKFLSRNEPETLAIGRAIGAMLRAGDVVAIDGELGAGKTRLVRGIAMGMGLDGKVVSSPTYVVVNEYGVAEGGGAGVGGGRESEWESEDGWGGVAARLFHVDAYRLSGPDDLDSLGWDRVMDPAMRAAVAIEWAGRISAGGALPEQRTGRVRIESVGGVGSVGVAEGDEPPPGKRLVVVGPPAEWRGREGYREMTRLAGLLREGAAANAPLPRGWARCSVTGKPVPPDGPSFPFADERSRLVDLGRWATGAYTISRDIRPEDEAEQDFGAG